MILIMLLKQHGKRTFGIAFKIRPSDICNDYSAGTGIKTLFDDKVPGTYFTKFNTVLS